MADPPPFPGPLTQTTLDVLGTFDVGKVLTVDEILKLPDVTAPLGIAPTSPDFW
jgi:hypothetical protein